MELSTPEVPNPKSAVKKFQIFYRIWKFITLFTNAPLWGPPWTRQSSRPNPGPLSLIDINMNLKFAPMSYKMSYLHAFNDKIYGFLIFDMCAICLPHLTLFV